MHNYSSRYSLRNWSLWAEWRGGRSYKELATETGLSYDRVYQIVAMMKRCLRHHSKRKLLEPVPSDHECGTECFHRSHFPNLTDAVYQYLLERERQYWNREGPQGPVGSHGKQSVSGAGRSAQSEAPEKHTP